MTRTGRAARGYGDVRVGPAAGWWPPAGSPDWADRSTASSWRVAESSTTTPTGMLSGNAACSALRQPHREQALPSPRRQQSMSANSRTRSPMASPASGCSASALSSVARRLGTTRSAVALCDPGNSRAYWQEQPEPMTFVPRTGAHRGPVPGLTWEPVSGIEPLTCRLQEVRFVAICALTALIPHVIALMALAELGFSGGSSHDSSHAAKQQLSRSCNAALIQRLLTNPAPGRRRSGRILSPPTAWRAAAWPWTASRRPPWPSRRRW